MENYSWSESFFVALPGIRFVNNIHLTSPITSSNSAIQFSNPNVYNIQERDLRTQGNNVDRGHVLSIMNYTIFTSTCIKQKYTVIILYLIFSPILFFSFVSSLCTTISTSAENPCSAIGRER